ncbi:hypothetical protein ABT346_04140 [Micromonospora peucetia]|uniref:hypothetical protein n=1 Tax=Micromonospora peucetia TaxID=47871 RepID=UPI0033349E91
MGLGSGLERAAATYRFVLDTAPPADAAWTRLAVVAAVALTLSRHSGAESFVLGVAVPAERGSAGAVAGMSLVPLRIDGTATVTELTAAVASALTRFRPCLHRPELQPFNDRVGPLVLRRLAARDPERASVVFRRLLKRPRFDWTRDGEELLRAHKPEHFRRKPRPRVSPVSERLAAYARRR